MKKLEYKVIQINKPSIRALNEFNKTAFTMIDKISLYDYQKTSEKIYMRKKHA